MVINMIRINSELIIKEEKKLEKAVAAELKNDNDKDITEILDEHTERDRKSS